MGELVELAGYRRQRAETDHRVANRLFDLDRDLVEVLAKISEWARVLGESTDRAQLDKARRWLLRLSEELDELKAEKRALETPRAGGRRG